MLRTVVATVTALAVGVAGAGGAHRVVDGSAHRARAVGEPVACTAHRGHQLLIGIDGQSGPLRVPVGSAVWFRLPGAGWTRPVTAKPAVVGLRSITDCGHGSFEAALDAVAPGRTAMLSTLAPPGGGAVWNVRLKISVSTSVRRSPVPAGRAGGGGLVVGPQSFTEEGTSAVFAVPEVTCRSATTSRAQIGLSGTMRVSRPNRAQRIVPWAAGLTISCSQAGHSTYQVGQGTSQYPITPGDDVTVSVTGGSCPGTLVTWYDPKGGPGRGFLTGCSTVGGPRIRQIIRPTVLLGARMTGSFARELPVHFRQLTVDGLPYRFEAHALRTGTQHGHGIVRPHRVPEWYRLDLVLG